MIRILALSCCLLFAAASGAAVAAERVALVIGVGAYKEAAPLKNPANDAEAVAASLKRLGFEVVFGKDLNHAQMRGAVRDFARIVRGAKLALFFYAGHGVQVDGRNYLIPVDAKLAEEADLDFSAVDVNLILKQINREAAQKIVILDACRDNPFRSELARSMGQTRSSQALGRGLAKIEAAGGSMISFATDPGDVALDGDGDHSPFTEALLKHIETPGLEINHLMQKVRTDVFRNTRNRQRPWTTTSLINEVYLAPPDAQETERPPPSVERRPNPAGGETGGARDSALEIAVWQAAEKGGAIADYEAYLAQFPNGAFSGHARARIERLQDQRAAAEKAKRQQAAAPPEPERRAPARSIGTSATEAALGLNRTARKDIQIRLRLAGHDPHGADGYFGNNTRVAISSWQQDAGFAPTAYLNAEQFEALVKTTEGAYAAHLADERRREDERRVTDERRLEEQRRLEAERRRRAEEQARRPLYNASSYCSMTGVTGYGQGGNPNEALWNAVQDCTARGGIPQCCVNGAQLTN